MGLYCNTSKLNYKYNLTLPGLPNAILYWNVTGTTANNSLLSIAVFAKNHIGYVAIAFNNVESMEGGDAVIGWIGNDMKGNISTYNLTSKQTGVNPMNKYAIINATVTTDGGSTAIFFSRIYNTGQHLLLKNNTNIVYASIGDTPNPTITKHSAHSFPTAIDFDHGSSNLAFDTRIVHALVMSLSWFILSLGILFARYLKNIGKDNLWFTTHRFTQIIGSTGSLIGLIIIIIYVVNISHSNPFTSLHPILGFLINLFLIIHFCWALCRPHKDPPSSIRNAWVYIHHYTGRILILIVFLNIPLGLCKYVGAEATQLGVCLNNLQIRPYLILHVIYVVGYLLLVVVLEIRSCGKKDYVQIQ